MCDRVQPPTVATRRSRRLKQLLGTPRHILEGALAHALSRHIGYTTGAYGIRRIASITEQFEGRPSLYQFEIVNALGKVDITDKYARGIIEFATAIRLVRKVASGPTPNTARFALTPEGAAVGAALSSCDGDFADFLLVGLLLESDADAYCVILECLAHPQNGTTSFYEDFKRRFEHLRENRLEWLQRVFPNKTLLERITHEIPWISRSRHGKMELVPLKPDYVRHHATPRRGWAVDLNHADANSELTTAGRSLLDAATPSNDSYIWLGTPSGTQEALGIDPDHCLPPPYSPSWNLLRPDNTKGGHIPKEIIDPVVEHMLECYSKIRLIHANQAPVASIVPFVYLMEWKLGYSVDTHKLLDEIVGTHSNFHLLSSRHSKYGYYQIVRT